MLKSVDKSKKACLIYPILQSLYCWIYFHWHCLRLPPPWPPLFPRAEQCKPLRMFEATFPSSDPSKMRLLLALMTRAHLFFTSCSASHVKCTCCGVSWDTGGGGRFLAPFHCHLTFLKSFHLPENLNIYRSPLSIYSVFLLLFPGFCAFVSPRPFLMLHSLNTYLVHTDSVTRIVPGPRDTETTLLPGRKNRAEYIFWDLRMCQSHS